MRSIVLVLALVVALPFAAPARAASAAQDPLLDEGVAMPALGAGVCHAGVVDLAAFDAQRVGDDLVVRIALRDASDLAAHCGVELPFSHAEVDATLAAPGGVVGGADGSSVLLSAFMSRADATSEASWRLCAKIEAPNRATSACMGNASFDGNVVTWTIPVAGSAPWSAGGSFAYDLRGETLSPGVETLGRLLFTKAAGVEPLAPYAWLVDTLSAPAIEL